ncbi:MAG: dTMP kinase [Ignavibacteriae bacterium]|nr:dTMP kinase [Ignavibacteriota bacterium]NOG97379.1 dTMP kinase [Ignavibacteriota bacterium]
MFITFEGLDFCGKSTQVKMLVEYLKKKNKKIEIIREPGGTLISEKIREILLDNKNSEMSEITEMLLFAGSRSQLVDEKIIPKLNEDYYVISDRFLDSSIAYQGYGRGIDIDFVTKLQKFVVKNALPDLTFFIDIPISEVEKRKNENEIAPDRIESSENNFYNRVLEGYNKIAAAEKRFIRIDGLLTREQIHAEIVKVLNNYEQKGLENLNE